ncbi:hypothetical protein, variant [Capsaspora owczarzaki ATCC 30864]|uniref:hypothetical protein, variant n=1 Tax=Capsaspora owczarzaki (strain ATCC 30864) TaxID=595528 RepID=UPI0003524683|nr:hypothetical protein, variant [Capsaspora owczarzaki ATCC 30864]|eukprot:XP_011270745.1 hypothetical protein, variant [Capsaspora owczarzaki ATCC 30864]
MASIDKSKIGWEHYADYGEGFHDRLATHWPEPREQLHAGGWRMTKRIALELNLADSEGAEGKHYLDLCCGEGASAIQLAKEYNCKITGIDIVEKAINRAKEQAKADKVEHLVTFVACNAFQLPFADGSFDAIFGQDPDALSHQDRVHIFRECLRVLKPNGRFVFFHHWIPGLGFPEDEAKAIDAKNEELKFLAMNNCNADTYLKDMKTAGFVIDDAEDIGDLAAAHLRGVALSHYKKNGKIGDAWLQNNLDYIDRGRRFGLWCTAHKEGSSQVIFTSQ